MKGVWELAFMRSSMVTELCKLELPIVDAKKQIKTNKQISPWHPYQLTARDDVDIIVIIHIKGTMALSLFTHRDLLQQLIV